MALIDKPSKTILQMSRQAGRLYFLSLRKQYWLLIIMALLTVFNMTVKQGVINFIIFLATVYFIVIFIQVMGALYEGQKAQCWQRCQRGFITFLAVIFTLIIIAVISLAIFAVMALIFLIAGFIVNLLLHLLLGPGSSVYHALLLIYGVLFAICYVICFAYINIAFYIAVPLVAIKKRLPFEAIAESFRLAKGKRWLLLGSYIYIGFITLVAYVLSFIAVFILMNAFQLSPAAVTQIGAAWILLSAPVWLMLNFFMLPLSYVLAVVVMFSLLKTTS